MKLVASKGYRWKLYGIVSTCKQEVNVAGNNYLFLFLTVANLLVLVVRGRRSLKKP